MEVSPAYFPTPHSFQVDLYIVFALFFFFNMLDNMDSIQQTAEMEQNITLPFNVHIRLST